jgi:phosphoglycolate phosphatase-like HAD superfamily hydrolase
MRDFPEIAPTTCALIGDSLSDIEAARNFGCRSIFIVGDPDTRKPGWGKAVALADAVADSLKDAVRFVIGRSDDASIGSEEDEIERGER